MIAINKEIQVFSNQLKMPKSHENWSLNSIIHLIWLSEEDQQGCKNKPFHWSQDYIIKTNLNCTIIKSSELFKISFDKFDTIEKA